MDTGTKIAYVLAFAVIGAGLYVWGLRKSVNMRQSTTQMLVNKCANTVLKQLKKKGEITEAEVTKLISGISAGPVWSRQKAVVQNPKTFARTVLEFLVEQRYIEKSGSVYRLKK